MSGKLRYTVVVRHPDTGTATALVEGELVPDWASDLVHSEDLTSGGYDEMTVDALKAEINARNEDRDDDARLPKTGTKADLVSTLMADDDES